MSLKPGRGAAAGRVSSVTVSPILVSATFLMVAAKKPTSPAENSFNLDRLGRQHTDRLHVEYPAIGHEANFRSLAQDAVDHATNTMTPR